MCCHNHCDTAIISIIIYNLSLYTLPSYHGVLMMPSSAIIQCYHGGISCGNLLWEGLCGAPVKPDCEQSSNLLTYEKKKYEELSRILQQSPCFSCCEIRRLLTASLRVSPPLALWQLPGAAKPRDPESQGHARSPFITCFSRKIINFSTRWSCLSFVSTFCNHFVHNKIIINRYGMS